MNKKPLKHVEDEDVSLPVAIRDSKTSVLKSSQPLNFRHAGVFTIFHGKPKFSGENSNGTAHSSSGFLEKMKIL